MHMPTPRAPVPYYGGKSSLSHVITSMMPEHTRYVEPFAGSLAVLLAKPPSKHEIVNDLDHNLMTFWRVLRDTPEALARACFLTPHSREERRAAIHIPETATDLERARLVWSALMQGRSGTLANTGWRHSRESSRGDHARTMRRYVERIERVAERVRDVTLECRPAVEVVERYGDDVNTLVYCDPPYLGTTRRHNYKVEMLSERSHRELADALRGCRATVILSGYHSELYRELYAGWFRVEVAAATSQGSNSPLKGVERTEVLWSNRELKPVTEGHRDGVSVTGFEALCARCSRVVPRPKRGPIGTYCSGACRAAAYRERKVASA